MSTLELGDKAIPFVLPGVDDQEHSLADYDGKEAVVVVFSCNHCPYVRAWEDRIIQAQTDYAGKGVQFIAINSNDIQKSPGDSLPKMKERAQEKDFNFPYLFDETQEVAHTYGAERTPEFFLFDKAGTLSYHGALDDNYENPDAVKSQYLRDALDVVLVGQAPTVSETPPVGCTIKWK